MQTDGRKHGRFVRGEGTDEGAACGGWPSLVSWVMSIFMPACSNCAIVAASAAGSIWAFMAPMAFVAVFIEFAIVTVDAIEVACIDTPCIVDPIPSSRVFCLRSCTSCLARTLAP